MKILILVSIILLSGCSEIEKMNKRAEKADIQSDIATAQCIKTGGMPIIGIWESRFRGCVYPPKQEAP